MYFFPDVKYPQKMQQIVGYHRQQKLQKSTKAY